MNSINSLFFNKSELKTRIRDFFAVPLDKLFIKFRSGAIYFGVGGILIYIANSTLPPSISQELLMLSGLILGAVGFVIAMMAQLRMIIFRFLAFFDKNASEE